MRKHFDEENIERLARSIENFGIIQPVTVRKFGKSYELISGERRVMAAKKAGLTKVPAIMIDTRFDIAAAKLLGDDADYDFRLALDYDIDGFDVRIADMIGASFAKENGPDNE
jgi:ParB/RepB/Spo0J family partition protein